MCKLQLHFQMGFTCHFASVLMTVSGDMNSFYGFPYFFIHFAHRQTDRENNEMYLFAVCISVQCKWWLQSGKHHSDVDHLILQWGQIFNYPPNSIHFNEINKSQRTASHKRKKSFSFACKIYICGKIVLIFLQFNYLLLAVFIKWQKWTSTILYQWLNWNSESWLRANQIISVILYNVKIVS